MVEAGEVVQQARDVGTVAERREEVARALGLRRARTHEPCRCATSEAWKSASAIRRCPPTPPRARAPARCPPAAATQSRLRRWQRERQWYMSERSRSESGVVARPSARARCRRGRSRRRFATAGSGRRRPGTRPRLGRGRSSRPRPRRPPPSRGARIASSSSPVRIRAHASPLSRPERRRPSPAARAPPRTQRSASS